MHIGIGPVSLFTLAAIGAAGLYCTSPENREFRQLKRTLRGTENQLRALDRSIESLQKYGVEKLNIDQIWVYGGASAKINKRTKVNLSTALNPDMIGGHLPNAIIMHDLIITKADDTTQTLPNFDSYLGLDPWQVSIMKAHIPAADRIANLKQKRPALEEKLADLRERVAHVKRHGIYTSPASSQRTRV